MSNPGLTDEQIKEAFETLSKHSTKSAAADALGISRGAFNNRIRVGVARGYSPEHDMKHLSPHGFGVKGTSTLYDDEGNVKIQWVKTTKEGLQEQEAVDAAIEAFKDNLPLAAPVSPPTNTLSDLLACYPVGDHHMGMLAWPDETGGEAYNIERSESLLCAAMDYLVDKAPDSEQALIPVLGDFFHYQGMAPLSESGHLLDADSRFQKMVRAGIRTIRYLVSSALKKHKTVYLILELGNHDRAVMAVFMEMFFMHFENEPRVVVDRSPRNCHVHEFGKNLIATHHGDKIKMDKLPLVIATDWAEIWGRTKYRTVLTGHVHHDRLREFAGIDIETFGILAPKDAYAAHGGWRAKQSMKLIVFHRELGEQSRTLVKPEMFK